MKVSIDTDEQPSCQAAAQYSIKPAKPVRLDAQQRKAVECDDSIPTLVLSGAGSGKTTVLIHRIAYLIGKGVTPEGIVACTFSRKSADELKERLAPIEPMAERANVNTIHGICLGILREEGLDKDVISPWEQKKILQDSLKKLDWDIGWRYPLRWIDLAKSRMHGIKDARGFFLTELEQLMDGQQSRELSEKLQIVYADYEREKTAMQRIDFVDMLFLAYQLLMGDPQVLRKWQARVTHVLIDEHQDTDGLQIKILSSLAAPQNRVFCVGDPDQSLYRWRGATPDESVFGFLDKFPNGQVLRMETNYRSTRKIVDVANRAIEQSYVEDNSRANFHKVLLPRPDALDGDDPLAVGFETTDEEADYVGQNIEELMRSGYRAADFFVLYRTNAQSRPIEDQMIRRGIPYVLAGCDGFYSRAVIKDVLAYLTLVENPDDSEAFKRVANIASAAHKTHYRGFGAAFYSECERADRNSLYRGMRAVASYQSGFKRQGIDDFVRLLDQIKVRGQGSPAGTVTAIRELCYDSYLRRKEGLTADEELDSDESGASDLDELVEAAVRFKSISSMLAYVRMVQRMQQMQKRGNSNCVVLSSIHRAKGLERSVVFGIGIADGLLPHIRALGYSAPDELPFVNLSDVRDERCGMFVLVSRAKERLFLTWPEQYRNRPMSPSRFLAEIGLVATAEEAAADAQSAAEELLLPMQDTDPAVSVVHEEAPDYAVQTGMAW